MRVDYIQRGEMKKPIIDCVIPVHDLETRRNNVLAILGNVPDCIRILLVHDRGMKLLDSPKCQVCIGLISIESQHELICGFFTGPGAARNAALSRIKAEWVFFLDSDDRIDFSELVTATQKGNGVDTDLIVGSAKIERDGRVVGKLRGNKFLSLSGFASNPGIWRCGFKSKSIRGLDFPKLKWAEDQVFIAKCLAQSKNTPRFTDDYFYTYITGSISQVTKNEEFSTDLDKARELIEQLIRGAKCSRRNLTILQLMLVRIDIACFKRSRDFRHFLLILARLSFWTNPIFLYQLPIFMVRLLRKWG